MAKGHAVLNKKNHINDGLDKPEAPKGPRDRDAEEAQEVISIKSNDVINEIVGAVIYVVRCSMPEWREPSTGRAYEVDRYYPHKKIIVDFPQNVSELEAKKRFFKKNKALKVTYLSVAPGESLSIDEFQKRLKEEVKNG